MPKQGGKMETNSPNWVQYLTLVLTVIVLIGGFFYVPGAVGNAVGVVVADEVNKIKMPVIPDMSIDTDELADAIIAKIEIPEAKDTSLSVKDYKNELAEELAIDYVDTKDFKKALAEYLKGHQNLNLDGDFDRHDIENIAISKTDVNGNGNDRDVKFTAKIAIDDDEDKELVKVKFEIYVENLDRSDDYEDAEVDEDNQNYTFNLVRCYNDYCNL